MPVPNRPCREVSGPNMTTLGMLLWEKVTLDIDLVLEIFIEVCKLLEETHSHGYAVGTLHPEGIVIVRSGDKLTSVHIKRSGAHSGIAFTDEISLPFDKANYLSPEQLDGLAPSPRSDIYAIGCMMFTALTGAPPFSTKSTQKLTLISANKQLESVYEHKVAFIETVIKRCLKDDECKRYGSVLDLQMALRGVLCGVPPAKSKRKFKLPFKLKTFAASFLISLGILAFMASIGSVYGLTEPIIQGSWNQEPQDYWYGDPFTIAVTTDRKSYTYVFYIDDKDNTLSLYPSKDQGNNVIAAKTPLQIGSVSNNSMHVDDTKGQIVLVSIAAVGGEEANKAFLNENDWTAGEPADHRLRILGLELLNRLKHLKAEFPGLVGYEIQDAPCAKKPTRLRFGKPDRVEVTLEDQPEITAEDPAWD